MSKSYMTLDEVAEKLDLDKSEVQGLITKEKLNVSYCWTPKGIRISRKSFEENWGNYSAGEAESAADTNMSVADAVTKAMEFAAAVKKLNYSKSQVNKLIEFVLSLVGGNDEATQTGKVKSGAQVQETIHIKTPENEKKLTEYLKGKNIVSPLKIFTECFGYPEEQYSQVMGTAIGRMMNARSEFRSVTSDHRRYYKRVNND